MFYVSVMMSMMLVQTRKNTEDVLQVSRNNQVRSMSCIAYFQHSPLLKTSL